jgi:hypothetical protein
MATITLDGVCAESEPKRGFLARMLDRMMEAQMYRARAIAKPYLLAMNDDELRQIGYTREGIRQWPSGARWL